LLRSKTELGLLAPTSVPIIAIEEEHHPHGMYDQQLQLDPAMAPHRSRNTAYASNANSQQERLASAFTKTDWSPSEAQASKDYRDCLRMTTSSCTFICAVDLPRDMDAETDANLRSQ